MADFDPLAQREFALEVVRKLRAAAYEAVWAGGCVRDQLLQKTPKDYDVATNAQPDTIRQVFGRRRTIPVGAAFGVIAVVGPPTAGQVEVTTFREDADYSDGRRPDAVTFSTAEEDAQRRDFTINGLFYDPLTQQVIDFVGGRDDLDRRVIRAIGSPRHRFTEDKLRLLRAVRFAATLEFELEEQTRRAVQEMAPELPAVSAERIAGEMRRMLIDPQRCRALKLLAETSLLAVILPELVDDTRSLATSEPWQAVLKVMGRLGQPSFPMALAGLCHCLATQEIAEIGRRWKLSNHERELAVWLVERLPCIAQATTAPWPKLQRLLVADEIETLLRLYETIHGSDANLSYCRARLAWPVEKLNPPPLASGDDLIAHGLRPGKAFRGILEHLRNAQLQGDITTKDEAVALAKRIQN